MISTLEFLQRNANNRTRVLGQRSRTCCQFFQEQPRTMTSQNSDISKSAKNRGHFLKDLKQICQFCRTLFFKLITTHKLQKTVNEIPSVTSCADYIISQLRLCQPLQCSKQHSSLAGRRAIQFFIAHARIQLNSTLVLTNRTRPRRSCPRVAKGNIFLKRSSLPQPFHFIICRVKLDFDFVSLSKKGGVLLSRDLKDHVAMLFVMA